LERFSFNSMFGRYTVIESGSSRTNRPQGQKSIVRMSCAVALHPDGYDLDVIAQASIKPVT
ncbi:hypothetical protein ACFHW1_28480, partial [Micromonospora sp. LOL_014]|uniref:hypothetical protein n=1 Tax=Micromonospora sp. LOL_014 TaxID=3345415 RepID=UPI003A84040D